MIPFCQTVRTRFYDNFAQNYKRRKNRRHQPGHYDRAVNPPKAARHQARGLGALFL